MKRNDERPALRRSDPQARGCCTLTLGVLLVCIIVVGAIYVEHNRPPDMVIPSPIMPAVNAYNDFVSAGQMARGMQHPTPYDAPSPQQLQQEQTLAYLAAFHKDATPVLAVLRCGLGKPYQNPPERSSHFLTFPQFARFRELARILAGEALYYDRSGQPGRAVDTMLDGWEMAVMIPRGGGLIAGLVGIACEAISIRPLEPLLSRLSPSELAQVAARLDRIESKRVLFADNIQEEGNIMAASYLELLRDPKGLRTFQGARSLLNTQNGSGPSFHQWKQVVDFYLADKTAVLRQNLAYFHAVAAESRRPYTGPSHARLPDNLLAQQLTFVPEARAKFERMIATTALLRAEVALYRYHAAYGRYPDTLAQLLPAYLHAIPDDPFGGGANIPLRYRVTNGGQSFLLYSLGPDMQDNGGTPAPFPNDRPGDIVAGQLWPRKANGRRR